MGLLICYCHNFLVLNYPKNSGWILIDGKCSLNWFEGEMYPARLEDIVGYEIEEDEEVH